MKNKNKNKIKNKINKNNLNKKINKKINKKNNLNELKKELLLMKKDFFVLLCELDIHSWVVNGTGKKNGKKVKLRKCKRCGAVDTK